MILIFTPKITNRIRYTFRRVFYDYLLYKDFKVVSDMEKFLDHPGAKFTYSKEPIEGILHFHSKDLLIETGIKEQDLLFSHIDKIPVLFTLSKQSALGFDVFAAVFFMLVRYEEYLPHQRDKFDRFEPTSSIAFQHGFLKKAVVDRWLLMFRQKLLQSFPNLVFPQKKYNYIPTLDIDNAYKYKEKGVVRTVGAFLRSLVKGDFKTLSEMTQVIFMGKKDPFDTYNYQLNIQKKYQLKPIYFILLGNYGINDKNIPAESRVFQRLIKSIADYAQIGIHPSFGSNSKQGQLEKEISRLNNIIKREIKKSRQHFLKLNLPETYRNLIRNDITEDYTMGFAAQSGFRAGTCTPYYFYDLDEEKETALKVFPFQVMEANYKYYMKSTPSDAIAEIQKLIEEVREVNGTFISLWHNESLCDEGIWKGWREVYEQMLEAAVVRDYS